MTHFRKKPVVIEAKQATGTPESNREIIDWTRGSATPAFMDTEVRNCSAEHPDGFDYPVLKINTLEGTMTVKSGDWIIKGVKGEFYPCKPDIFAATYDAEPVQSSTGLPPHQQRVLDEKSELDDKLQKLTAFISSEKFSAIVQDEAERGRLVCQEETMKDYSAILAERIEAFGAAPITLPVVDPGPDSLEREIQAKANKAPRVMPADVRAEVVGETYTVLPSGRVTVCELTLKNGFTVRGESAVVHIENFDADIGRKVARENAEKEVWQLLGFRLRDELASDRL